MKTGRHLTAALIAFLLFAVPAGAEEFDSKRAFEEATALLEDGKFLESFDFYAQIIENASDDEDRARAWTRMGGTYSLFLKQYDDAVGCYDKVLEGFPKTKSAPAALFKKGETLYAAGKAEEAGKVFSDFMKKYPKHPRAMTAEVYRDEIRAGKIEAPKPEPEPKVQIVRVAVVQKAAAAVIGSTGGCLIQQGDNIKPREGELTVKAEDLAAGEIEVRPAEGSFVSVNGESYRGSLRVIKEKGKVTVLNYLPLEEYLYGVLPREISASWHMEAQKAQAVAARTYALFQISATRDKLYDVTATTASQVYGGYSAEKEASRKAVDETKGQILAWAGRPIIAYFHSNSGGFTEAAKNVWVADLPYLRPVPDPICAKQPAYEWSAEIPAEEVRKALGIGPIKKVEVLSRTASGRIEKLALTYEGGVKTVKSNRFRLAVGAGRMRSTLAEVELKVEPAPTPAPEAVPETATGGGSESVAPAEASPALSTPPAKAPPKITLAMKGKGFGHGVGMAQWGAYGMAKEGRNYREILAHYYPGTMLMLR